MTGKRVFLVFIEMGTDKITRVEDVTGLRPERVTMPDHIVVEATETNRWFEMRKIEGDNNE